MIYRFGDCELDTVAFELRRDGTAVATEPQVLELLRYLVENNDRMVTKDELIDKVWLGRIVSDSALSSRIKATRQAIGDDGQAQRLIRTIHGRGFRFVGAVDASAAPSVDTISASENSHKAASPAGKLERPSIAIFPFDNMSGDPEQEYFSDGITEDIITALSKYRWFSVTARNSTFAYKGRSPSVREIAGELGVRYVMKGSVRRAGERVRITCQLVDAGTGNNIWAERYDRELRDIFEVQDEITSAIVGAVGPELASAEQMQARRNKPENLDAWDLYQQGMWHFWRYTRADGANAKSFFERAVALDPGFADVHAARSMILVLYVLMGWTDDEPEPLLDEARNAARTALAIDDRDAFAHYVCGRVHAQCGENEPAIAEFHRALDLNPNFGLAQFGLGFTLVWSGRETEAIPYLDRAIQLSPNDPIRWGFEELKGLALWAMDKSEEALAIIRRACRHPNIDFWPLASLAAVLVSMNRVEEAKQAIADTLALRPDLTVTTVHRAAKHMAPDRLKILLENLRIAGLPA